MDTIYSLVTKPINQNVAVIRISGPDTFFIIKKLIPNILIEHNKIQFQKIFINNEFVDDVLILMFKAPHSFTGEDVIEIQFHGSMFIVQKISSYLNSQGIRQAEAGEFMKQAYMNGKLDLSQSEAINTLILSDNKKLAQASSKNLNGEQTQFINTLLKNLGEIVSRIQIAIDHPENTDLPKYNLQNINQKIKKFCFSLQKIIDDSKRLIKISKGIVISIIGIPNSGKSTLLNSLLKEDKAIVSSIEGTTRDIIESSIYLDDFKITFQDTAGIKKDTLDIIEKEGIIRSIKSVEKADIVIFLLDPTKDIQKQKLLFKNILGNFKDKIIEVHSKSDISKEGEIKISAFKNDVNQLLNEISKFIKNNIFDNDKNNNSLLITQKQIDNFKVVLESLKNAIILIEVGETEDIVAFELENAMKKLGIMIGKKIDKNYLENLFASFCVGK